LMVDIPSNFSSAEENEQKCECQKSENMDHIYYCEMLNQNKPEEIHEKIFHGRLDQQISVLQRFEENFKKRMKILAKLNDSNHMIHNSDPLYSDLYSNGYGNGCNIYRDCTPPRGANAKAPATLATI
jgi:hypothetical protein